MFNLDPIVNPNKLIARIDSLLDKMAEVEEGSPEYTNMTTQLNQLYKALEIDTNIKTKVLDTYGKQNELESRLAQQEAELDHKKSEMISMYELKLRELAMRQSESDVTVDLRSVETDLKKKEIEDRRRVSPDTVAAIAANVVGILLIIGHERISVISTKALGFIPKVFK